MLEQLFAETLLGFKIMCYISLSFSHLKISFLFGKASRGIVLRQIRFNNQNKFLFAPAITAFDSFFSVGDDWFNSVHFNTSLFLDFIQK